MPYTPELFNRYNERVMESRNAVSRHIMYLLRPDDGYPKGSDEKLKQLYNMWRADCRAMDAACEEDMHLKARQEMIEMPPDDKEHFLCRRMAAVIIECNIFGEHIAGRHYLPDLVEEMKASICYKHPHTCACHYHLGYAGWTFENYDLMCTLSASYEEKQRETEPAVGGGPLSYQPAMGGGRPLRVACAGWRDCSCGGCSGGGPPDVQRRSDDHVAKCACGACHNRRVANGTQDAYMEELRAETNRILGISDGAGSLPPMDSIGGGRGTAASLLQAAARADDAIDAARAMPGGSTDLGFVKNLFQTVQGVKFDDKCPHGLPFYACMSCSH